jgi:t-SNARE complex subunit (syntaxin)
MDGEENTDAHNNSAHRELRKRKLIDGLVILLLVIVVVVVISSCLKFV